MSERLSNWIEIVDDFWGDKTFMREAARSYEAVAKEAEQGNTQIPKKDAPYYRNRAKRIRLALAVSDEIPSTLKLKQN